MQLDPQTAPALIFPSLHFPPRQKPTSDSSLCLIPLAVSPVCLASISGPEFDSVRFTVYSLTPAKPWTQPPAQVV